MKTTLRIFAIALFITASASRISLAQITINNSDMPSVNDTYVVNSATPSATIDPVPTGPNHGWDFASLTSATQNTDTFKSLIGIGSIYAAAFIGSSYGVRSAQDINLGVFTMEKIFNLYKNSSAKYEGSGQGAEINSVPTPMVFNPRDLIYKFPLNYNDVDSGSSEFSISVSTLITYRKFRTRVNVVDGWGTLDLPSGSYEVLRVKSVVTDRDSIVVNGFALPVIPNVTTEYKWLGKQQGEPLLQINANQVGVTQVLYLDNPVAGVGDISGLDFSITSYPNPASGEFIIHSAAPEGIERIEIYDSFGKKVYVEEPEATSRKPEAVINTSDLSDGIYFLKIVSGKNTAYKKIVVVR